MKVYEIKQIGLDEYQNCGAIWNMKDSPYTEMFIKQIKSGVREVFVLTVDGAFIAECDLVYDNPEYGTIPGQRAYLSRLIVKRNSAARAAEKRSQNMRSNTRKQKAIGN